MTKQQYYDLLICSAFDGTFPSKSESGCCSYRTRDGKHRCAIGILIPENEYDGNIEGKNLNDDYRHVCLQKYYPEGLDRKQMVDIQNMHDGYTWSLEGFIKMTNEYFSHYDDVVRINGVPLCKTKLNS